MQSELISSTTPFTIVSADSHAGLPPEEYRPYFDPQYRDAVSSFIEDHQMYYTAFRRLGYPFDPSVLDVIDSRGAIESGGTAGFFDPVRRLRVVEEDGVVAEVLHPAGPISATPFYDQSTRRVSPELRAAGAAAYNRFLAEFCSANPRRLLGVGLTYPYPDMEAAARAVQWARESGLVAVFPARFAGVPGDVPPLHDPVWDTFWAACAETAMPVHIHAGHGNPQGQLLDKVRVAVSQAQEARMDGRVAFGELFQDTFQERRPLWQLMWGGVFDRFPGLRIVFAEVRTDWVPPTLAFLESRYDELGQPLPLRPTEYWKRHCTVGASFMRHSDLAVRDQVGTDRMMFGTDYPHAEGTWPNTLEYLRIVLSDVQEDVARRILGENAIEYYGLDAPYLASLAAKFGPTPDLVLGRLGDVDPRLVDHFIQYNGLAKSANVGIDFLETAFREDAQPRVRKF